MFRGGVVVFLCAWAALTLPWERCHAACHDRVLPAGTPHDCHVPSPCGRHRAGGHDHGHDHEGGHRHDHDHDRDGTSDHDPLQFDGVARAPAHLLATAGVEVTTDDVVTAPARSLARATGTTARAGPDPGLRCVVLLL